MKTTFSQFVALGVPFAIALCSFTGWATQATAQDGKHGVAPKIAWYPTLEAGLEEAERSNRPILFTSAAPQCLGVSGIW